MPLLPFDTFSFETPLSPGEVGKRLAAAIEPRQWFRRGGGVRPFAGEILEGDFRLKRIINYRNSFVPRVHGRVIPAGGGSRVEGSMTLHPVVIAFMAVWFTGVLVVCAAALPAVRLDGPWPQGVLVPLGMLVFGWVLATGGFTFEARKAHSLLAQILEANQAA